MLHDPRPVSASEVFAYAAEHGLGVLKSHLEADNWLRCGVDPRALRDMHGVFGREGVNVPLEKGRRFDALFGRYRARIESGDFPCADEIGASWRDRPAITVQRSASSGALYVSDGEKRTFNALFHNEALIDAFVVTVDEDRELLDE